MSSILESLLGQLQGPALSRMAADVGADEGQVRSAATAAIPLLLGALARNASSADGAKALHGALQKDHDGSLLDNVQAFLGGSGGRAANGVTCWGHGPPAPHKPWAQAAASSPPRPDACSRCSLPWSWRPWVGPSAPVGWTPPPWAAPSPPSGTRRWRRLLGPATFSCRCWTVTGTEAYWMRPGIS